jgi:hypothetical protein
MKTIENLKKGDILIAIDPDIFIDGTQNLKMGKEYHALFSLQKDRFAIFNEQNEIKTYSTEELNTYFEPKPDIAPVKVYKNGTKVKLLHKNLIPLFGETTEVVASGASFLYIKDKKGNVQKYPASQAEQLFQIID